MDDTQPGAPGGSEPGDEEIEPGDEEIEPGDDGLDPREEARIHRRDHDAEAHRRELLRPGMAKVFKQITDSWGEKAAPDQPRPRKGAAKGSDRPR